jgi:iron complex outermembrane receptor protein
VKVIHGYFGITDVMATFTPSLSGVKGRALFSLLFMAPLAQAADTTAAKDGETLTVTADPKRRRKPPTAISR